MCDSQCAHSVLLPLQQLLLGLLALIGSHIAHAHHHLRCTFYINGVPYRRRHILALGREWFACRDGVLLTYLLVVHALIHQPPQQCLLRRVTHIVRRRRIQSNGLSQLWSGISHFSFLISHSENRHSVFGQRTRLVRTYTRYGTHRL